jgi:hypothetical protein
LTDSILMIISLKTTRMKINTIWQELESDLSMQSGLLYKRLSGEMNNDLYVALRMPEKLRCIAAHISKSLEPPVQTWAHLKDIKVEIFKDNKQSDKSFLLILLLNQIHKDIFSVLCEDLFIQVSPIPNEKDLIKSLLNRLVKWETLFQSVSQQGMSSEVQRGLYGELFFLHKFISKSENNLGCVNSWLGPSRAVQDFQFGDWAVEVKTTHGNNHQKIHISSERQLDNSLVPFLFLYHLSIDIRTNHGESLNDMVSSIRRLISSDANCLNSFSIKLHEVGYFDYHLHLYEKTGYQVRNESIYHVTGDFPRIIESSLAQGVGDVKYSIIVSDCISYSVKETDLFNRLTF